MKGVGVITIYYFFAIGVFCVTGAYLIKEFLYVRKIKQRLFDFAKSENNH